MKQICTGRTQKGNSFRLLDVDYYPSSGSRELAACIREGYRHIIIDFGEIREEKKTEFFRCDSRLVVVSFSEWQMDAFWEFYGTESEAKKDGWTYLAAFGSEETRRELEKRLKLLFLRIPVSVDAFSIDREMISWFEEMLAHHK